MQINPTLPRLLSTSNLPAEFIDSRQLIRDAEKGILKRIRRGFYVDSEEWQQAGEETRYELLLNAVSLQSDKPMPLCGPSAAFLWGLPMKQVPTEVWQISGAPSGGRNAPDVRRIRADGRSPEVHCIRELECVDPLSAVLDLAKTLPMGESLALMDRVLNPIELPGEKWLRLQKAGTTHDPGFSAASQGWALPEGAAVPFTEPWTAPVHSQSNESRSSSPSEVIQAELLNTGGTVSLNPEAPRHTKTEVQDQINRIGNGRARARLTKVLGLSDAGAFLPGESMSRFLMFSLGFQQPQLQVTLRDRFGNFVARPDFWWPLVGIVGEFDGNTKYIKDEYLNGRSPSQVVIDEKRREDRIRQLGVPVIRWGWSELQRPDQFAGLLEGAGISRDRKTKWPLSFT